MVEASAAKRGLFKFLEIGYNLQRRRSTQGYLGPVAYEEKIVSHGSAA